MKPKSSCKLFPKFFKKRGHLLKVVALFVFASVHYCMGVSYCYAGKAKFYSNCIMNDDNGIRDGMMVMTSKESFYLGMVNNACYQGCQEECNKNFSKKDQYKNELNHSIIYACMSQCQQGNGFSSQYLLHSAGGALNYSGDGASESIKLVEACSSTAKIPSDVYKSNITIDSADFFPGIDLTVSVLGDNANKVYLCGKNVVDFTPVMQNLSTDFPEMASDGGEAKHGTAVKYFEKGQLKNDKIQQFTDSWGKDTDTVTPPKAWQKNGKSAHECFTYLKPEVWNGLSDYKLWNCYADGSCPKIGGTAKTGGLLNCRWDWHVRNKEYVDTGISVKSGDELAISWSGDVILNLPVSFRAYYCKEETIDKKKEIVEKSEMTPVKNFYMDYRTTKLAYFNDGFSSDESLGFIDEKYKTCPDDPSKANQIKEKTKASFYEFLKGKKIENVEQFLKDFSTIDVKDLNPLIGEEARQTDKTKSNGSGANPGTICGKQDSKIVLPNKADPRWYGLKGRVMDGRISYYGLDKDDTGIIPCSKVDDVGLPYYMYSGTVGDEGQGIPTRTPLRISHHFKNSPIYNADVNKVLGGYQVKIDWGGCPVKDGLGAQYALVLENSLPDNSAWKDLGLGVMSNEGVVSTVSIPLKDIPKSGKYVVYFRIKPTLINEAIVAGKAAIGAYHLALEYPVPNAGFLQKFIKKITKILFDSDDIIKKPIGDGAAIITIYTAIASNIRPIILAFMTLYLTFLGINFMIGTVQITQAELVKRVAKIAVILALVSGESWKFFGGYLAPLFVGGALELAANVSPVIDPISKIPKITKNPMDLFNMLDGGTKFMFNGTFWSKILALCFANLLGFIIALIIIRALLLFTFAMLKVTLTYILSLIGVSMLLLMAPVFVPMMLFQLTQNYFTQWYKYLIAFGLYPVFMFSTISLFYIAIVILMEAVLNYSVCEACYLGIPIINYCLLSGYRPILNNHAPSVSGLLDLFTPMGVVEAAFCLYITAGAAVKFASFAAELVNQLTIQSYSMQTGDPSSVTEDAAGQVEALGGQAGSLVKRGASSIVSRLTQNNSEKGTDSKKDGEDSKDAKKNGKALASVELKPPGKVGPKKK
ncbi:type IV secretion system protein VirB6 [Alphaproteobacteria bacterium]